MVATATQTSVGGEQLTPFRPISDAQWAQLNKEAQEHAKAQETRKLRTPMHRRGAFLFRTEPDVGHPSVFVQVDSEGANHYETEQDEKRLTRVEKRFAPRVGADTLKLANQVSERLGTSLIAFVRIGRTKEAYFSTTDLVVAEWFRAKMAEGKGIWARIYEDRGQLAIKVGERLFPNTPQGREAAFLLAFETGQPATMHQEDWMDPDDPQRALTAEEVEEAEIAAMLAEDAAKATVVVVEDPKAPKAKGA